MKYSQATKKQLYDLAMNETISLKVRYAAARELLKRKVKQDDRKM